MTNSNPSKTIKRSAISFLLIAFLAVICASGFTGYYVASQIENDTKRLVDQAIPSEDIAWVATSFDGSRIEIGGEAPTDFAEVRVLESVGKIVNHERIINNIQLLKSNDEQQQVRVEIVQNQSMSSVVGILPKEPSPLALFSELERQNPLNPTVNLVETSFGEAPENWAEVLSYLERIVGVSAQLKISASPTSIEVDAVAPTREEANELTQKLSADAPQSAELILNVTSPRPFIVPFALEVSRTSDGFELHQCSARGGVEASEILRNFEKQDTSECAIGLGAPTERWGALIKEIATELEMVPVYDLKISDNEVEIQITENVTEAIRQAKISSIRSKLPPGFALKTEVLIETRSIDEVLEVNKELQLVFELNQDKKFTIEGVVNSPTAAESFESFAVAKFGGDFVEMSVEVIDGLPTYWEKNAFTMLQVTASLAQGRGLINQRQAIVEGRADDQEVYKSAQNLLANEIIEAQVDENIEVASTSGATKFAESTSTECVENLNFILSENPIQFENGSATVSEISMPIIARLGQALHLCRAYAFELGGHTDSVGSKELNDRLSKERAASVLELIYALALEMGPLSSKGYGSSDPVASDETEEGRSKNRRIEIRLVESEGIQ